MMIVYTPEMNEPRPTESIADAEYFYGKYYVNTALELSGRGIEKCDRFDSFGRRQPTETTYAMTKKAFEKFSAANNVTVCVHLD